VTRTTRLTVVLLLNLALVAGLVAAGIGAHSVGVLAAGGDYLADAAAGGVAVTGAIILADPALAWLDPTVALVIAAVIGYQALALIRQVVTALR
jgi:cobalt-zinc-cadmium efflux system protein